MQLRSTGPKVPLSWSKGPHAYKTFYQKIIYFKFKNEYEGVNVVLQLKR